MLTPNSKRKTQGTLPPQLPIVKKRCRLNTRHILSALDRRAMGGKALGPDDFLPPSTHDQVNPTVPKGSPCDDTWEQLTRFTERNSTCDTLLKEPLPHSVFLQALEKNLSFEQAQEMAQKHKGEKVYETAIQGLQDLQLGNRRANFWCNVARARQEEPLRKQFRGLSLSKNQDNQDNQPTLPVHTQSK